MGASSRCPLRRPAEWQRPGKPARRDLRFRMCLEALGRTGENVYAITGDAQTNATLIAKWNRQTPLVARIGVRFVVCTNSWQRARPGTPGVHQCERVLGGAKHDQPSSGLPLKRANEAFQAHQSGDVDSIEVLRPRPLQGAFRWSPGRSSTPDLQAPRPHQADAYHSR